MMVAQQQHNMADVVNLVTSLQLVMMEMASVAMAAVGGYLAYVVVKKSLNWMLDREESRLRHRMEEAAAHGDLWGLEEWGDQYEMVFGEEARAQFDGELNRKYRLWRK
jgi:hypothetical protein